VKTFRLRYSRDLLVLILKQPSNVRKGLLKSGSFEALVKMSIGVLDACVKHDDVTTAWGVLSIAEFYYREVPRRAMKVKDKLQGRLRDHRMWQRLSLWENAFVEARQSDLIRGKRTFESDIVSCCSELIFLMLSLGGSERMAHMFVKRVAQVRRAPRPARALRAACARARAAALLTPRPPSPPPPLPPPSDAERSRKLQREKLDLDGSVKLMRQVMHRAFYGAGLIGMVCTGFARHWEGV
jgi:hypothetical protein